MQDYTIKTVCLLDSDSQGRNMLQVGNTLVKSIRPLFDSNGALYGVAYVAGDTHRMIPAAAIRDIVLEPKTASGPSRRRG